MRRTSLVVFTSLMLGTAAHAARAPKAAAPTTPAATASVKRAKTKAAAPTSTGRYTATVSSTTPLFVGIAVDHSKSNAEIINGGDRAQSKAERLAEAVNNQLEMMLAVTSVGIDRKTNQPLFKPWFRVKAVGYSTGVRPLIEAHPGTFDIGDLHKSVKWLNEDGKLAATEAEFARMTWIDPVADGNTHMGEGLLEIQHDLEDFVAKNPNAPAPVVMHFTDGQPMGGRLKPVHVARDIMALGTKDGKTLMFNVHVGTSGQSYVFPNLAMIKALPAEIQVDARRLFEMSSPMPPHMILKARQELPEYDIPDDAHMMVYNASSTMLTSLLELGTIQNAPTPGSAH